MEYAHDKRENRVRREQGDDTGGQRYMTRIPLVNELEGEPIYSPSIHRGALLGAVLGGIVSGVVAWGIAAGFLPIAGLGQFSASGAGVATFAGAGTGLALGGLIGSLIPLYQLPKRRINKV